MYRCNYMYYIFIHIYLLNMCAHVYVCIYSHVLDRRDFLMHDSLVLMLYYNSGLSPGAACWHWEGASLCSLIGRQQSNRETDWT